MFIVELTTKSGKVCESYATYAEAQHRVDQFPADRLLSLPLIFQELADGSQRLVREDGKPLQWHRILDDWPDTSSEPIPLLDVRSEPGASVLGEDPSED
jgi:hypothetical protein